LTNDLGMLVRPAIEGLAGADLLVVVTTGGPPVADLGPLAANVRAAEPARTSPRSPRGSAGPVSA
jgi:hypothetical protein